MGDMRCNNAQGGTCGIHVHPGMSCDSHALVDTYQGVHRDDWADNGVADDGLWVVAPFTPSFYTTTGSVTAVGSFTIESGQTISALAGHSVVVHSYNNAERIACGILSADGQDLRVSNWVQYPGTPNPGGYVVQGTVAVTAESSSATTQ